MLRSPLLRRAARAAAIAALVLGSLGVAASPAAAAGALSVTPVTWDIVGLDSVTSQATRGDGPDRFPIGVRICNTGDATLSGIGASLAWDSVNAYITSEGPTTVSVGSLTAGQCGYAYFTAAVARDGGAYDTTRAYHVTATGTGGITARTPVGRQLYVEHLVSQNRNKVRKLTGAGGCNAGFTVCDPAPTALTLGQTYTYKLYGQTSAVYDQVESFVAFPNGILQILSATSTFSDQRGTATVPLEWDSVWGDACSWDSDPTSGTYRECTTDGSVGGDNVITYVVKAISLGTGRMKGLFYDFSGSSFHYNEDFNDASAGITITVTQPSWDLTTGVVGSGSVSRSLAGTAGCGTDCASYTDGTQVTLTATPAVGWHFAGWSGTGCSGTAVTCTVTMDRSRSVTAFFEQDPAGLNVSKGASSSESGPFTSALSIATGATVWYRVVVTNTGAQALTGLTFTDSMVDGLPETCDPLPASLATGESYTCIYSVEAADGTTVNTVTVDSDQTEPAEAEATVEASLPPTDRTGGRDPFGPIRLLLLLGVTGLAGVALALRSRAVR